MDGEAKCCAACWTEEPCLIQTISEQVSLIEKVWLFSGTKHGQLQDMLRIETREVELVDKRETEVMDYGILAEKGMKPKTNLDWEKNEKMQNLEV